MAEAAAETQPVSAEAATAEVATSDPAVAEAAAETQPVSAEAATAEVATSEPVVAEARRRRSR